MSSAPPLRTDGTESSPDIGGNERLRAGHQPEHSGVVSAPRPAHLPLHVGKYEITGQIGRGGFGVVYKGRDPFIKRAVAIKTCSSRDETVQRRFFREAEIAGNLHHPNIVTIHDFGVDDGTPFLVQEFLDGEDLDLLMQSEFCELDLQVQLHCLKGVAEALSFAHAQGVIHRDVKPGNVRVLENGAIKVMDFGIAKLKGEQSQLTRTGITMGTAAYLSPEQLQGDPVDHRADIFSFGVLAYELICNRRPFSSDTVSTTFFKILHVEVPLIMDDSPASLRDLVFACMQKDPKQRPGSFEEISALLDDAWEQAGFMPWADPVATFSGSERRAHLLRQARARLEQGEHAKARQLLTEAADEPTGVLGAALAEKLSLEIAASEQRSLRATATHQPVSPTTQIATLPRPRSAARFWLAPAVLALVVGAAGAWWWSQARSPQSAAPAMPQRSSGDAGAREEAALAPATSLAPAGAENVGETKNDRAERAPVAASEPTSSPARSTPGASLPSQTPALVSAAARRETQPVQREPTEALREPRPSSELGYEGSPSEGDQVELRETTREHGDDNQRSTDPSLAAGSPPPVEEREEPAAPPGPVQPGGEDSDVARGDEERAADATSASSGAANEAPAAQPGLDPAAALVSEPEPEFDLELVQVQNEIRAALDVWSAAWKSLDHRAIQRIHPSAGVQRRDLRPYDVAEVELRRCTYEVNDAHTAAVARCAVRRVLRGGDGKPLVEDFGGLRLLQQDGRWVITELLP